MWNNVETNAAMSHQWQFRDVRVIVIALWHRIRQINIALLHSVVITENGVCVCVCVCVVDYIMCQNSKLLPHQPELFLYFFSSKMRIQLTSNTDLIFLEEKSRIYNGTCVSAIKNVRSQNHYSKFSHESKRRYTSLEITLKNYCDNERRIMLSFDLAKILETICQNIMLYIRLSMIGLAFNARLYTYAHNP